MVQLACKCSLFITIIIIDQVINLIILLLLLVNATIEKMLQTRRLSAWLIIFINHQRLNVEHLIVKLCKSTEKNLIFSTTAEQTQYSSYAKNNKSSFLVNKKTLLENKELFSQWLVGFTDGDGTFSIQRQNKTWSLIFKLSQSTYNLRLLHYVKNQLGVGSI